MVGFRSLFSKAVGLVAPVSAPTLASMIDAESIIGGKLFGDMGRGVERRFFLDEGNSWFFSESATDPTTGRKLYSFTIRYEILPQGVLKSVDGKGHVFITGIELEHLKHAVKLYEQNVERELYAAKRSQSESAAA
jgi:hypothetical protein